MSVSVMGPVHGRQAAMSGVSCHGTVPTSSSIGLGSVVHVDKAAMTDSITQPVHPKLWFQQEQLMTRLTSVKSHSTLQMDW